MVVVGVWKRCARFRPVVQVPKEGMWAVFNGLCHWWRVPDSMSGCGPGPDSLSTFVYWPFFVNLVYVRDVFCGRVRTRLAAVLYTSARLEYLGVCIPYSRHGYTGGLLLPYTPGGHRHVTGRATASCVRRINFLYTQCRNQNICTSLQLATCTTVGLVCKGMRGAIYMGVFPTFRDAICKAMNYVHPCNPPYSLPRILSLSMWCACAFFMAKLTFLLHQHPPSSPSGHRLRYMLLQSACC